MGKGTSIDVAFLSMEGPVQSVGTMFQLWLSRYLYAETLHTLGSYRHACKLLEELDEELKSGPSRVVAREADPVAMSELANAVSASLQCNKNLRNRLHRSPAPGRDHYLVSRRPSPFSDEEERSVEGGVNLRIDTDLLADIARFYRDSEAALQLFRADRDAADDPDAFGARLGAKLAFTHDPQRRGSWPSPQPNAVIEGKIGRTRARLVKVKELCQEGDGTAAGDAGSDDDYGRRDRYRRLLESHAGGTQPLTPIMIRAFNEAHVWMHKAENVLAAGFGEMFTRTPEIHAQAEQMLRYAGVLNTFVFVASRAACWSFAEDDLERQEVIAHYESSCDNLAPTYCMWISAQMSLLALHRRAFTWWTRGEHDVAYRDFHKLTRLLRGLRKPAEKRGLRVPGTRTFLFGITAMSELHIGRIYRGQHAYRMAECHFRRASRYVEGWERDDEIGPLMKSSHWRVNLLLNEGKASFELGNHKRSMLRYAKAWRAFLLLVESETDATANVRVVEGFISWLEQIVDDPEISRVELRDRIEPLVEQFITLRSPVHLRLLAADVVMRMGHLIFILRLPHREDEPTFDGRDTQRFYQLASDCIEQALLLDPASTLGVIDLLNIQEARRELEAGEGGKTDIDQSHGAVPQKGRPGADGIPLRDQWPSGGGAFEDAARVTELTLQQWLAAAEPQGPEADSQLPPSPQRQVAVGLLRSFLTHTDSSNMKLAQVYGYLMRDPKPKPELGADQHALELVCLRRYSSFFPFLPRPAAFRASGGGYLVQVHEPGPAQPFGIAIDPGPDFIENLYASGYSIADIHMIILTHDHADHVASVDALLALMGIRRDLYDMTFTDTRCLAIVGNESVRRRYEHFGKEHPVKKDKRTDVVRVLDFEEMAAITAHDDEARSKAKETAEILLKPRLLRIEPVRTWGHTDANGYPSQGFLLKTGPSGEELSILFSGDTGSPTQEQLRTGRPAREDLYAKGDSERGLLDAVEEADIVVAHLSAVPLKELRALSGLDSGQVAAAPAVEQYRDLWNEAVAQTTTHSADRDMREGVRRTEFLLKQIQFGFRSRPERRDAADFSISPFSDTKDLRKQPERHLYLTGVIEIAERMARLPDQRALLLIGELREELGTFRTQIARRVREAFFGSRRPGNGPSAMTTDIGLRVRLARQEGDHRATSSILCSTCDLDNDLLDSERYHSPEEIHELCVKGEDEGVFYNCSLHDPRLQKGNYWVESVERYNVFGD